MSEIADTPWTAEAARNQVRSQGQFEANARALSAAHGAHVRDAMDSVRWERRGLLQRLTRRAR